MPFACRKCGGKLAALTRAVCGWSFNAKSGIIGTRPRIVNTATDAVYLECEKCVTHYETDIRGGKVVEFWPVD